MDEQQEREVARGLREGQTEAWQALYDAYSRPVWQLIARLMGARSADVADVVQETFLAAARSARSYDRARGSLWVWLGGIARNHVALNYRKQQRHPRSSGADRWPPEQSRNEVVCWLESRRHAPAELLESAEMAALVRAVLTELPVDYETLLTARYLEGISVTQLAAAEQCSATAVRSKLARARRAFRAAFLRTNTCPQDS